MITQTKLTSTVRCCKLGEVMTDSFYINGACPPCALVPINKALSRSTRCKVGIFAISDGFGENDNASFASYKTVATIKKFQEKISSVSFEKVIPVVNNYLDSVNSLINSFESSVSPSGSSVAMLVVNQGVASAINVGNCRVYLHRYGRLNRLTQDHTESQRLISIGALRTNEENGHPAKKVLTKYLGMNAGAKSVGSYVSNPTPLEKNDLFLLCSNGLTDALSDDRISYILSLKMSDERIIQRLISEAVARGAEDNITVMIVRNGGKNKPSKVGKGIIKITLTVIVFAFFIGFIASSFKGCSKRSDDVPPTPTPTPGLILRTE